MGYEITLEPQEFAPSTQGGTMLLVKDTQTGIIEKVALFCGRDGERTAIGRNGYLYTCKPYEPAYTLVDGKMVLSEEPLGENLIPYSEDFNNSFWVKDSGVSITSSNNVSVDSKKINSTLITVTDDGRLYANNTSITGVSSIYIKKGTFAYLKISTALVDLNLKTTTLGVLEELADGWFRFSSTELTGTRILQVQAYPNDSYLAHNDTGSYYIWGAQLEEQTQPTSYIPTNGSTGVRLGATGTKTPNISKYINSEEFVISISATKKQVESSKYFCSISNEDNSLFVGIINYSDSQVRFIIVNSGTQLSFITSLSNGGFEADMSVNGNNVSCFVNGVNVDTRTISNAFNAGDLSDIKIGDPINISSGNLELGYLKLYPSIADAAKDKPYLNS